MVWCALALFTRAAESSAQTEFRNLVDHIHLAAPDQARAVEWYAKHFGGQKTAEGAERLKRMNLQNAQDTLRRFQKYVL